MGFKYVGVPIFKGWGDVRSCICYRSIKLLEHRMKVVGRVLEKDFVKWLL